MLRFSKQETSTRVILFTKVPLRGFVKTRLAQEIGKEKALKTFYLLLKIQEFQFKQLQALHPSWIFEVHLGFPELMTFKKASTLFQDAFKFKCSIFPQSQGTLDTRMLQAFMKNPFSDLSILLGSDVVGLTYAHFFAPIMQADSVSVAPSRDQGYGLLALPNNLLNPEFFPSKTDYTYQSLAEHCQQNSVPVRRLAEIWDIDYLSDIEDIRTKLSDLDTWHLMQKNILGGLL